MKATTGAEPQAEREQHTNLHDRYGEIGIMAVAAALPYAGSGRSAVTAPTERQHDERFEELAA